MALILSLIIISILLGYFSAPLWAWFIALAGVLFIGETSVLWWIPAIALAVVLLV